MTRPPPRKRFADLVCRVVALLALGAAGAVLAAPAAPTATPPPLSRAPAATAPQPAPAATGRPRVGLVLSGGGARGIAHVGVLKVLERERIPVDLIAGTSMGAIIGGLYASGMSAERIERELRRLEWDRVFAPRVSRQQLSQRLKEEDFELSTALEFGIRDGELRAPQSTVSSRGLEVLLRRFTLPARDITEFDRLPIPFRAVATDMETGLPVVMSQGDLALALRSSMSVPGVFAPVESEGRVLGDGGLVNNLPVDVARAMGADVVIAVNIGTPLAGRETLGSLVGLTSQMINILTEQNVRRSLALLQPKDVLVAPDLTGITSADFERTPELLDRGEAGGQAQVEALRALAVDEAAWSRWLATRAPAPPAPTRLAEVRFEGSDLTNPERLQAQMESQPGKAFDPAAAERDVRRLAATGDFRRTDYTLRPTEAGDALVFELEEKPWGPNYVRVGLDVSTDFDGNGGFNLKLSHSRRWLTPNGTEWRNRLQIGVAPAIATELYHPLNWTIGLSNDWFVSGQAAAELRSVRLYGPDAGRELGRFNRTTLALGLDLGQPWGGLGELRLGVSHALQRVSPQLLSRAYEGSTRPVLAHETGLRGRLVVDQLDFANFPQSGYRFTGEALWGIRGGARDTGLESDERFRRAEADMTLAWTRARHTFSLYGLFQAADPQANLRPGRYALGGFHQLSGYEAGQVRGNAVLFGRLTWYRRLSSNPVLTRGFFVGATLEAGDAWRRVQDLGLHNLRLGGSVFLGADTGLGPLYFGLTYAPEGSAGMALFIGRP